MQVHCHQTSKYHRREYRLMTTNPDPRLKARVAGRDVAKEVLKLANEEAVRLLSGSEGTQAWSAFWEEVREFALSRSPLPDPAIKILKTRPMSDAEARGFEKETVPLSSLKGKTVAQAMETRVALQIGHLDVSGPEHLLWLADQTFVDDLRRYLANETVARRDRHF